MSLRVNRKHEEVVTTYGGEDECEQLKLLRALSFDTAAMHPAALARHKAAVARLWLIHGRDLREQPRVRMLILEEVNKLWQYEDIQRAAWDDAAAVDREVEEHEALKSQSSDY